MVVYRARSKVTQVRILPDKDQLIIDDNHMKDLKFPTVADCVDYLKTKKLVDGKIYLKTNKIK